MIIELTILDLAAQPLNGVLGGGELPVRLHYAVEVNEPALAVSEGGDVVALIAIGHEEAEMVKLPSTNLLNPLVDARVSGVLSNSSSTGELQSANTRL